MQWSVEEQTIRSTKPVTLTSIVLRVDPSDTSKCLMEMHGDGPNHDVLHFDRNGAFVSIQTVEPSAPAEPPTAEAAAHHSASSKKK